jgi:hypothetical protein
VHQFGQPICLAICSENCYISNTIARSWALTGDCNCLQIGGQRCSDRRKASRFTKKLKQGGRDMPLPRGAIIKPEGDWHG